MPADPAAVKALFLEAVVIDDPAARAALLNERCRDDAALLARVNALLVANDRAVANEGTGPFDGPAISAAAEPPTVTYRSNDEHLGSVLAGKYKLIEAIGEGGMGSVYMARQTEPVKRAVAVKVIKAGMDTKAVLARFEAERQALAMMDHPNIARVLDAGTTESGLPFFVMELVKGVTITRFCDERKLTPRQRLELFVPVCLAIQHAHQKGVIHRDIKPSNVLVAMYDDRPVAKVIDFGVAKAAGQALTDKTLMTGLGAVVGTPEYMSPEQANLNNLDIDTRSDVYSLGVLLYELLTGSTPVDRKSLGKAALLEILRIVREVEAPRPSAKLSTLDSLPSVAANRGTEPAKLSKLMKGELDWLVLKALEKDRTRRYETANALSRDIQRYLADEVVEARPPSTSYRLKKFVRRHKGQVIAASLILIVLIGGVIGTTWQAFRANDAAEKARQREADAVTARNETETANGKLTESQGELQRSNDQLLSGVARSLLRPLAVQVQANQPLPPLNEQEIEPLWELASTPDERLRLRFVEVALQDPDSTRRLKDRSEFAFQAAVGLDPTRRTHVEELLGQRLQAREIPLEQQGHVALCLTHLSVRDQSLAKRIAATLIQAMSKTTDPYALRYLAEGLSAVAARLEPEDAAKMCRQAAVTLTQTMTKATYPNDLQDLAKGLSAVAAHLGPKDAAVVCRDLTQAMSKVIDPNALWSNALWSLVEVLSAVATRLEPKDAPEAAGTLTQAMSKTTDPTALRSLAEVLSAVATRLEPQDAVHVCGQAADTLTQAMTKTTNDLQDLAKGLSAVAAHLGPKDAAKVCRHLTQAMTKTTDPDAFLTNALWSLVEVLSAVATRLEPKDAPEAAGTLTQAMSETTNPYVLRFLSEGLSAVAARLRPKEAAEACGQAAATLTQAMNKTTEREAFDWLAEGLSRVVARLEPKDAAICRHAATTLTNAMTKTTDPYAWSKLADSLSAVVARLGPKEAAEICRHAATTLTNAMTKTTDPNDLYWLAEGLSAVAARLEPKDSAICRHAAITLTQAMTKTTYPHDLYWLVEGLSAVAACLEPNEAAKAVATLTQAMTKTTEPKALRSLSKGLSAVAARLRPKEAAEACGQAAATLTQAMSKTTDPFALQPLSEGLSAVAARLEPKDAAQVCQQAAAILSQAMTKTTDPKALLSLLRGLSAVAERLEPRAAAEAAGSLTQAMTKTPEPYDLLPLSVVLCREDSTTARQRFLSVAATLGTAGGPGAPFAALGLLQPALEPQPPPLPVQTLVDLLKNPFCVGEARRLVLEQLSRHYQRPFTDQWEFVEYVTENKLPFDLTTPPARPK